MSDFTPLDQFVRRAWIAGESELPPKINYACGQNILPGWLNTDLFDGSLLWAYRETGIPAAVSNSVFNIDLLERHPFPDNSFSIGFCEDFIEHLNQKSAMLFLSEVYRTLSPGGVFRIATPGLDGVLKAHFNNADYDQVVEQGNAAYDMWGHVHFFSHATLESVVTALGFVNYTVSSFGQSGHAELADLETRQEQVDLNLYAEFEKPAKTA